MIQTKLFSDLYLAKFLDTSAKILPPFSCGNRRRMTIETDAIEFDGSSIFRDEQTRADIFIIHGTPAALIIAL